MKNFFTAISKSKVSVIVGTVLTVGMFTSITLSLAGSLTPPGAPANTFFTLSDLYNLASGTIATEGSGGLPATPGNATGTMYTLTQVYNALSTQVGNISSTTLLNGTTAFGKTGTFYPSSAIKSGQAICYAVGGATTTCSGTGQDGELQKGLAFSYTDNGDGTILDNQTGLTWQKATTTTYTWANALTYCNANTPALPGTGWRLPNAFELFSLVDFTVTSNAKINLTYFPGTVASFYWSATSYPDTGLLSYATGVDFDNGSVYAGYKTISLYVRCVRG